MITISNFVGNEELIKLLYISIEAAKAKNVALPHILLKGPAGTGKTTLAEAIAKEFGTSPLALTPNSAKSSEDLRKFFLRMPGDGYDAEGQIVGDIQPQIVFIDEVHQLSLLGQENLGVAMQDWKLPVRLKGVDVFMWVPRFTLIGATTLAGKLSKPFLDRFKIQSEFETYSLDETLEIVHLHAGRSELRLEEGVDQVIAKRSRGIARLVVRFLDRLSDAAVVGGRDDPPTQNIITRRLANRVFRELLKIDDRGLTKTDIKILRTLHSAAEPVGVDMLATIANEDKATVERAIEPYLIHEGLLLRTKRGRTLSNEGRRYLIAEGYVGDHLDPDLAGRIIGAPDEERLSPLSQR